MDYLKYPDNFMELVEPKSSFENSKAVILPVSYEKTTTFNQGTKKGPDSIIENSAGIMWYDDEIGQNICDVGICTLRKLRLEDRPEVMMDSIYRAVKGLIENNKFPVVVGGEHSITQGCVKAAAEETDLSVLQIDAHTDLADEWDGTRFSHACVGRRCFEITKKIVPVGIRSLEKEEAEFAEKNNIRIFYAREIADNDDWFDDAISDLSKNVYITLDLDGLDPSFMPSVGNPEPGGLQYYQTLRFLRKVFEERNVVGLDVVELCPDESESSSDFTAAKIIYKMIGYKFCLKK
jgi:agmatinase